jgi:predicted glycosyltransferase
LILVTNHLTKNIRAEIDLALEIGGEPLTRVSRVLSFDEVLADPEIVDRDWGRPGVFDFAGSYFDEIWIHGERWLYDWEQNYRLPTAFARKLRYVGHLGARLENGQRPTIRSTIRAVYQVPEALPLIVITGGGGHDAVPMFEAYISSLRSGLEAFSLFLTGPRMSEGDSARVEIAAKPLGLQRSRVLDFVPNFLEVIAGADLVVSMGGFTVHEILATGTPVIFVPRGDPSSSQWLRTKIAAEHGWATVLPVERLTPRTLAASAQLRLADSRRVVPLTYDGFARVHKRLLEIAELVPTMPAGKSQQSRVATDD